MFEFKRINRKNVNIKTILLTKRQNQRIMNEKWGKSHNLTRAGL